MSLILKIAIDAYLFCSSNNIQKTSNFIFSLSFGFQILRACSNRITPHFNLAN